MWFFRSPKIIFGEDALQELNQLQGSHAVIVTDKIMVKLGFVAKVQAELQQAGIQTSVFDGVEPDPTIPIVQQAAELMHQTNPNWIIGLGGGSSLDAAKAAWFLYERPDIPLDAVNPFEHFGLRAKARFITIPTTAGSGAEVTAAAVITDPQETRKIEVASYELLADLAIIDPTFSAQMPPQVTADTGIDVLTHAVEGYASTWANNFSDGICLQAAELVFTYLPRAYQHGANDMQAREKMANAATLGGLGITNSHIALAHALGHSAGALFGIPHGRITGLLLPYTVEYTAFGGAGRYLGLTRALGIPAADEKDAGLKLGAAIRELLASLGQPVAISQTAITATDLENNLEALCDRVEMDVALITSLRIPQRDDIIRLYRYAFDGKVIDF